MKGSLRQRSPGSWELTFDLGRDTFGKRRRKHLTVRGSKAHAQRELRCLLTTLDRGIGARVGHPEMTVHSLRHFHASVMLHTGQNIVVVSKRLGHSNVSDTSDIYVHTLPGWQRQAADAFADAMEKGGKRHVA